MPDRLTDEQVEEMGWDAKRLVELADDMTSPITDAEALEFLLLRDKYGKGIGFARHVLALLREREAMREAVNSAKCALPFPPQPVPSGVPYVTRRIPDETWKRWRKALARLEDADGN